MTTNSEDKEPGVRAAQTQLDLLGDDSGEPAAADGSYGVHIRASRRARRLSVRVYPDARVEVVVPLRARPGEVQSFVAAHREWIDAKRAVALARRPAPEPFPPATVVLPLAGHTWHLHLSGGQGRLRLTEVDGGTGGVLVVAGAVTAPALRKALRAWLLRVARRHLEPRVAALAARCGVRYAKVAIRRQRSRWGSCSVRGTISLNACLLFQRPEVVDYLVIHELMHVRHMNHSARFWHAVAGHCAGWRALDRELLQGWRHVPRWVFSEN